MPKLPQIALLGTGLMGFPMSQNLLSAGMPLTVWNRSPQKAEPLAALGATCAQSPGEAVASADVVITMLSDGSATEAIIEDSSVRESVSDGTLWIDMSSIKPAEARAQSESLAILNCMYLDAPVSGGTKGAEAASLAIMVGGEQDVFEKAVPVLSVLGRPVLVGGTGAGQLAKLANQTIVAITIGAVAEATLLLEKGGANAGAVRNALKGGFADSVILQQHGERMSERNFAPGGLTKFQLKDLVNALEEAEGAGLHLPTAQAIKERFEKLTNQLDGGELDHSALFVELCHQNGIST